MKKTIFAITATVVLLLGILVGTAKAQIFLSDYDQGDNPRQAVEDFTLIVGTQGSDADQSFTPLGNGVLMLMGLGGAYLLKSQKRDGNE